MFYVTTGVLFSFVHAGLEENVFASWGGMTRNDVYIRCDQGKAINPCCTHVVNVNQQLLGGHFVTSKINSDVIQLATLVWKCTLSSWISGLCANRAIQYNCHLYSTAILACFLCFILKSASCRSFNHTSNTTWSIGRVAFLVASGAITETTVPSHYL